MEHAGVKRLRASRSAATTSSGRGGDSPVCSSPSRLFRRAGVRRSRGALGLWALSVCAFPGARLWLLRVGAVPMLSQLRAAATCALDPQVKKRRGPLRFCARRYAIVWFLVLFVLVLDTAALRKLWLRNHVLVNLVRAPDCDDARRGTRGLDAPANVSTVVVPPAPLDADDVPEWQLPSEDAQKVRKRRSMRLWSDL